MSDHGRGGTNVAARSTPPAVTKAQKFEDEKRRIISSCFSKLDTDGSLLESYITHCKIVEDAAYPSSPPPPESPPESKKPRVILVAVRKSGRVRMHKARENNDGSFSIGKTWNLDDLQQIENFPPPNERGFTISILKPYFWQANSIKEKEFFLQSILKIYKKYTGGKVPKLVGFGGTEIGRIAEGATVIASGVGDSRTQISSSTLGNHAGGKNLLPQQPLRSQQSSPSIRTKDDGLNAPSSSSLRSMQSVASLPQSRGLDSQINSLSLDTQGASSNVRRRPSDTSSTRSGMSGSNIRADRTPTSGPSLHRSEDQGSERSNSIKQVASLAEAQSPTTPASVQMKSQDQSTASPLRKADVTIPKALIIQEQQPTPGKKKSAKDIANTFKLAAASYTAAGLLGKKPSTPTGSSPTIRSPLSTASGASNSVLKDKISGPIIDLPLKNDDNAAGLLDRLSPISSQISNAFSQAASSIAIAGQSDESQKKEQDSVDPLKKVKGGRYSSEQLSLSTGDETRKRRSPSPGLQPRKGLSHSFMNDIDTSTLAVNIADVLKEFNWDWKGKVESLELDVKRELAAVEAKNVLINPGEDERLEELGNLMDKAIQECEEMDGLLTLYAVELTSLTDDIAHIENQSQGLQVQTANQKALQKELETIISTVSISSSELGVLKQGSLETPHGLEQIESTLLALYKAMQTIDPSIGRTNLENSAYLDEDEGNIGSIRALQERKEVYRQDCKAFFGRLRQFMNIKFQAEMVGVQKTIRENDVARQAGKTLAKPTLIGHGHAYQSLYKFSGLLLFAKEVDKDEFLELQRLYERPVRGVYQEEFRDHIFAWRWITRKPTAEETECVFTSQEKDTDKLSTTVRTLTVKKSQTLGKIRSPISETFSTGGGKGSKDTQEGKIYPHEAFSGALNEIFKAVCREQNFIMEFFHLSTKDVINFADFAASGAPDQRQLRDLGAMRTIDPDRMVGRMLLEYMGEIFSFLLTDLGNLVEWAIKSDPVQGVGILQSLEGKHEQTEETNQEFMMKTLRKLHDRLSGLFDKFLEEQIRAIEDTKLKLKKRKGIIPFMRIFPVFCTRIEDQLPLDNRSNVAADVPGVRQMVNNGYRRINKAMFESLQAIAKESPIPNHAGSTGTTVHVAADPEDKEQLNYHIMMIENMNYYVEEVDMRENSVLAEFMKKAEMEYREHMGLYVGAVIRRPLGKILDFIESLDAILKPRAQTIEEISTRMASHSKPVFKKILSHYDSKEVRRGIETLRKRVDKHFSPDDEKGPEAAHARRLLSKIAKELMDEYLRVMERLKELVTMGAYQGLEVEFTREDIVNGFTK